MKLGLEKWKDNNDYEGVRIYLKKDEMMLLGGQFEFNDKQKEVLFHSRKGYHVTVPYDRIDYIETIY